VTGWVVVVTGMIGVAAVVTATVCGCCPASVATMVNIAPALAPVVRMRLAIAA
jgi:hypothetical protein